jgi:hypothetical protein
MGGTIVLKEMNTTGGQLRARPFFWQLLVCTIVIGVTLYFTAVVGPTAMPHPLPQDAAEAPVETEPTPE